jgi:hypothetical protein
MIEDINLVDLIKAAASSLCSIVPLGGGGV